MRVAIFPGLTRITDDNHPSQPSRLGQLSPKTIRAAFGQSRSWSRVSARRVDVAAPHLVAVPEPISFVPLWDSTNHVHLSRTLAIAGTR